MLDVAEAAGGPKTVIEVVRLMVETSRPRVSPPWSDCFGRFVVVLQLANRAQFMDALEGRWNAGYLRCLNHIRRLRPDVPGPLMNQRLLFLGASLGGVLASRERELADTSRDHPTWRDPSTLDHAILALSAMVEPD